MIFKGPRSKTHEGIPIQRAGHVTVSPFWQNQRKLWSKSSLWVLEAAGPYDWSLPCGRSRQLILRLESLLQVLEAAGPHVECCSISCVAWQECAEVLREKEIISTAEQGLKQTLMTQQAKSRQTLHRVYTVKNYTSHKNKSINKE